MRGWAKVTSRQQWMEKHLPGFRMAHRVGTAKAWEFVDSKIGDYYQVYHFTLALNEEPLPNNPPRDPEWVEVLSPEEEDYKGRHVAQMHGVRVEILEHFEQFF